MAYVSYNNTLAYLSNAGGLPNSNPNALGGLRFSRTVGQRVTATLTGQSINFSEFSFAVAFKVPSSLPEPSTAYGVFFIGPSASTVGIAKNIGMWINSNGDLLVYFRNDNGGGDSVNAVYYNFTNSFKDKIVHFVIARPSSGNAVIYINGSNASSSFSFGANNWTWQSELTSTYLTLGSVVGGSEFLGDIYYASIYNLALSASDVLEIYSNNGRVPLRYQWESFNSLVTGDNSTFTSAGNWIPNPPATISGGKLNLNNTHATNPAVPIVAGKQYRIQFTLDSISAGFVAVYNGSSYISIATTAGAVLANFLALVNESLYIRCTGGNAVVDNLTLFRLGAVAHYVFQGNYNDSSSNILNAVNVANTPLLSSSERFFATNFSAQNNTNFQRIKRIGRELDYYNQVGPKSSTISTTVVPVSGFFGNQINTFLSYTGDSVSGVLIQVPNYQFDKCFLKSMSVNFEPWKLAYANLQFDSYGLASGSGIYSNPPDDIAPSIITPLRATTITLLTGSGFNRNITEYENISFDVSVDRAANFEIGQEYPTTVSVAKITKTLQINGISNLNWVSDYEPNKIISCNIGMVDGNSISVSGVVSTQSLSIDANGVAKTNLTVVEEMV